MIKLTYGVFGIVPDGRLLTYHYLQGKDIDAYITFTGPHIEGQE